jgi:hypothetical protein
MVPMRSMMVSAVTPVAWMSRSRAVWRATVAAAPRNRSNANRIGLTQPAARPGTTPNESREATATPSNPDTSRCHNSAEAVPDPLAGG